MKCIYCGEECREELLPPVIGFSIYINTAKDYICNNPECNHFGKIVA